MMQGKSTRTPMTRAAGALLAAWRNRPHRLFDFSCSSAAAVFGIQVYGDHSDAWWHRLLVCPAYAVGNRVHRWLWEIRWRWHPRHRYHLINTGLRPGYYDADHLMLHGMFALLCRYVDDEMGGVERIASFNDTLRQDPDPNGPEGIQEGQASAQQEAVDLYLWWTRHLPAMRQREGELLHVLYGDETCRERSGKGTAEMHREMRELREKISREEQEMLHRLVDIRLSLWT